MVLPASKIGEIYIDVNIYVVVVVGKKGPRRLDVSRPGDLELEAHALLVSAPSQLVHLRAQLLRVLGGLGCLGNLALQRRDPLVALRERRLVLRACPGDTPAHSGGSLLAARTANGSALATAHLHRRALESGRHRRLCRLTARLLRLTRDLRLRGRAIVPVTHKNARFPFLLRA